ncbi:MAG: prephenate dehydratase [Acidobacteriota bacterium]
MMGTPLMDSLRTEADVYDAAYQGAPGAYSEAAAHALLASPRTWPRTTLEDVFVAVRDRRARHGVVPVENTLAGTVPNAYELLLAHEVRVVAETEIHIDHVLIAPPGCRRDDVRRVLSHPVALAQCTTFFRERPMLQPVPVFDTAGAVEMVMHERDGQTAAIAGRRAATLYGAEILAEHLQDHEENWTRFLLIANASPSGDLPRLGGAGTAMGSRIREAKPVRSAKLLVAFDLPHEPGSLARALTALADGRVNLTKIESRPIIGKPFEYRFIAELSLESTEASYPEIVDRLQGATLWLRVLGSCERRPS